MSLVLSQPIVLIGHRGVGKSNLLARLKKYFPELSPCFLDLDCEIEKHLGQSIGQFFLEYGEEKFRHIEQQVFTEIYNNKKIFILSLGAGFDVDLLPENFVKVWLRRETDVLGRIFLNRPRLEKNVTALQEYKNRCIVREPKFTNAASFQNWIPEGLDDADPIFNQLLIAEQELPSRYSVEKKIFSELILPQPGSLNNLSLQAVLTLLPEHFRQDRFEILKRMNPVLFECRNDLLNTEQIQQAIDQFGAKKILFSFRLNKKVDEQLDDYGKYIVQNKISNWDWGLELGPCPFEQTNILSIHELPLSAQEGVTQLQNYIERKAFPNNCLTENTFFKLSPVCESFEQLKILWDWQHQDPIHRSILPRSLKNPGCWRWFRLYMQDKQKMNFFRCDVGSAADQPYLFQTLSQSNLNDDSHKVNNNETSSSAFAAVLGLPTAHSRSPIRHHQFFYQRQMPFYNIDIDPEQFESAMTFLQSLGLTAAAVTAPLKELAFNIAQKKSVEAEQMNSANTLFRLPNDRPSRDVWHCHNTDFCGLQQALQTHLPSLLSKDESSTAVYVWGGGGTLPVIKKLLPLASLFSLRTGKLRTPLSSGESLPAPKVVIWAAGPQDKMPPPDWQPDWVIDLNYREDSLARQYALQIGAKYIDGLSMFEAQASAQQKFWSEFYGQ